jgi:hypothetical protein
MGSFGIGKHAHIDAGFFAILLTLLTYGVKWLFALKFPDSIFVLPTFLVVFIGFYAILYIVFLIVWSKK